jgi:hypothetical protein
VWLRGQLTGWAVAKVKSPGHSLVLGSESPGHESTGQDFEADFLMNQHYSLG